MKPITQQALQYLRSGLSIIPIGPITLKENGGKNIAYPIAWTRFQHAHATENEVTAWFEIDEYPNIGIITGKVSGLFVLDTDSYKPGFDHELLKSWGIPVTPCQRTARGGRQYFFRYNGDATNAVNVFAKDSGVDIRANGGMVIAPPSKTSYGEYTWEVSPEEVEFAPLPQALQDLFASSTAPEQKQSKPLTDLVGLKEGEGRDNAMTSFAGKLMRATAESKWLDEVWPAMQQVNQTYLPPLPLADMQRIYESIASKETKRAKAPATAAPEKTPDQKKAISEPAVKFGQLMATEFPPARFALDPFFEFNTVNMVSAPPNTWKSWLLFLMAAAMAQGEKVLGKFETTKMGVMIVNEEDSSRAIQDRFKLLGITEPTLDIYFRVAQGAKLEKEFVEKIIEECKALNIGIIMFDSLRAVHDADENDSTTMQGVMDQLKHISRSGITVVVTHHHRKKSMFQKGDNAEASRGSSAINAALSGHISLDEEDRESGKYLIVRHLKSKAGAKLEPFELKIEVAPGSVGFVYDGDHESQTKQIDRAKGTILSMLTGDAWMTIKELTGADTGSKTVIRAALKLLEAEKQVESTTRGELEGQGKKLSSSGQPREIAYRITQKGASSEVNECSPEQGALTDPDFADFE